MQYFSEGTSSAYRRDVDAVVNGIKFVRAINTNANSAFRLAFESLQEEWPGTSASSDDALRQWVEREAWGHHASCTAKMGAASDTQAVLNSRLQVRGTANLRVVDASVFPTIPGTFILVPTLMVAEKASAMILQDAR